MPRRSADSPTRYININQLAEQIGVTATTLYRWRAAGVDLPPAVMIGSRLRWRQETVDAWAAAREAAASGRAS